MHWHLRCHCRQIARAGLVLWTFRVWRVLVSTTLLVAIFIPVLVTISVAIAASIVVATVTVGP